MCSAHALLGVDSQTLIGAVTAALLSGYHQRSLQLNKETRSQHVYRIQRSVKMSPDKT